jgi:hypothetical protein
MQPITVEFYDKPGQPRVIIIGAGEFIAWQARTGASSARDVISNPFNMEGWAFVAFRALVRQGEIAPDADFEAWAQTVGSIIIGDATEPERDTTGVEGEVGDDSGIEGEVGDDSGEA